MIELNIPDMTCGHCVSTVDKTIHAVDPAAKATIDLSTRKARVETAASPDKLAAALDEAGYPVTWTVA